MKSKTKSLVIVALVIVIAAMGVGGYFLFTAPNVPTDEIPSGSISGNTPSGDIGSGSVDVPDVPEEPIKVEIKNLEFGREDSSSYVFVLSYDTYSKYSNRISTEGYADIELVIKNYDVEDSKLVWTLTCGDEAVDVSEYFLLKVADDSLSVTLRAFRLLTDDDADFVLNISNGENTSSIVLKIDELFANQILVV